MTGIEPVDALKRAAALFGEVVVSLADDEWELESWPQGWTVSMSVAWVVVGDAQVPTVLTQRRWDPVGDFDAGVLGVNPVATWRGTAVAALAALDDPSALDATFEHPAGLVTIRDLVGVRVTENLVRAVDVGEAVRRPPELPDDLAQWCLDFWAGHVDAVMAGAVLPDAPVEPPTGAGPAERLLALTGRAR